MLSTVTVAEIIFIIFFVCLHGIDARIGLYLVVLYTFLENTGLAYNRIINPNKIFLYFYLSVFIF